MSDEAELLYGESDADAAEDAEDEQEQSGSGAALPGFTVTEINTYVKNIIECSPALSSVNVWGEISNWRPNKSGHAYFTLKDAGSVIKAVMWKNTVKSLPFDPKDGMNVSVHGSLEMYVPYGCHQLICDSMHRLGVGELYEAFEALKKKLEAEGLFRQEKKKKLPRFPRKIGIVTSPSGAAIKDMMNIFRRRSPTTELIIFPAAVQGAEAPAEIIEGIRYFDQREDIDLIIIGRGGGSIEDLWCFNDENLARVIAACGKPIISAVGHEIDFTISDLAADVRAPTPSAAAEIAVPNAEDLKKTLSDMKKRLDSDISQIIGSRRQAVDMYSKRRCFSSPESMIGDRAQRLDALRDRLDLAESSVMSAKKACRDGFAGRLEALSPLKILARGYGLVSKDGVTVRSVSDVSAGDGLDILLADGKVTAEAKGIVQNINEDINTNA